MRLETFFMQHRLNFNFSLFLYAPFEPTDGFRVDEIHGVPLCIEKVLTLHELGQIKKNESWFASAAFET